MKKIVLLAGVTAAALSLAACGGTSETANTADNAVLADPSLNEAAFPVEPLPADANLTVDPLTANVADGTLTTNQVATDALTNAQ